MTKASETGRWQQRRRTRKDLLQAAARLLKQGHKPTLEEVADEADVSRATAYRYFTNVEALLYEAPLDVVTPEASDIFNGDASGNAVSRLEKVDDVLERVVTGNETAIRLMLANSLQQRAKGDGAGEMPVRQDRRTPLIEAALAPSRAKMKPADLAKLKSALALIVGTESMIVFRDVLQLGDTEARKVRRWAIRALVDAAMK